MTAAYYRGTLAGGMKGRLNLNKIRTVFLTLLVLGLLAGVCFAAQPDLSKLIEFRDLHQRNMEVIPVGNPWKAEEILGIFSGLQEKAPGLFQRAAA